MLGYNSPRLGHKDTTCKRPPREAWVGTKLADFSDARLSLLISLSSSRSKFPISPMDSRFNVLNARPVEEAMTRYPTPYTVLEDDHGADRWAP